MSRSEMLKTVEQELAHIPGGPKGSPQRFLRMHYQIARTHNLGKNAEFPSNRSLVMKQCLEFLGKSYPSVKFLYDKEFFGDSR